MQCLFCEKRLGLFAWRRPFCSTEHAAAYQDQQRGLALSRVMDPRFTGPVLAEPARDPSPSRAPHQPRA